MTIEDLKKVIGEEVRKAVKQELRDLILEAVEVASRPEQQTQPQQPVRNLQVTEHKKVEKAENKPGNVLQDVLAETAASMTSDDYENIYGTSVKQSLAESYSTPGEETTLLESSNEPVNIGVNLDGFPSFVKNAKAILDASYNKDRERNAV